MHDQKLLERDWRFILETVYQLNSIFDLKAFKQELLESLMSLIPCDHIMLTGIEFDEEGVLHSTSIDSIGTPAKYIEQFCANEEKYNKDSYFRSWDRIKTLRVFRDSDMMPDEYREQTDLYKDIYSKQGIYYGLRAYLAYEGDLLGVLTCFNPKERGDFTDHDLEILNMLAPHITLHLYVLQKLEENRARAQSTVSAMDDYDLTKREQEIIQMIMQGNTDEEITEQLFITHSTLKKHIYHIYQKTDVKSRIQLLKIFA